MEKYSRLGKNTILVFIGNIGSKLITFIMLPFYTKWLSVTEYGVADIISIYSGFLLGIVSWSIAEAIFIFPNGENRKIQQEYFSSGLSFALVSFFFTAIVFFVLRKLFHFWNIENTFTQFTWLIFSMLIAVFIQNYMQQFSRSIDKIKVYAISGILLTAFTSIFAFLLIPKYGVSGFILSQVLAFIVSAIYSFIFTKAYSFFSLKYIKKDRCRTMLRYSVPLIPNGIMWWIVSAFNRPILEYTSGMNSVGLFAVANKFPALISVVFLIFISSWQISVLEEFKKEGYKEFYNKILRIVFLLITFISCGLSIFSKWIISIMADEKYFEAWKLVPILSIAVLFSSLSGFTGANFSATKESKYFFYSSIWGAMASVIFNVILIPIIGAKGAAAAVVLAFATMAISRIKYSWKLVQIINFTPYVLMVIINMLVVLNLFYMENLSFKIIIYLILLSALVFINKSLFFDLKQNLLKARKIIKNEK